MPYIILVSFDGFRSDYINKIDLPNFREFIKNGSSSDALIPCFPSLTFPNQYSIVTGLYPKNHGIVSNIFYDPTQKTVFKYKETAKDPNYYSGKPIWQLAKENGLKTAAYFWPGSEVTDIKKQPDYFFNYSDTTAYENQITQVLKWLKLSDKERPHFIALYFSTPDSESHSNGPWGLQTKKAIIKADSLLGYLMTEVRKIQLPINVILTSDHGLTEVKQDIESSIFLNEIINLNDTSFKLVTSGQFNGTQAHIYSTNKKKVDSLYQILKRNETNYQVYLKRQLPKRWQYQSPRVGEILIIANPNYFLRTRSRELFIKYAKIGSIRGEHGYDPTSLIDMNGIFYANGPNIKAGVRINTLRCKLPRK